MMLRVSEIDFEDEQKGGECLAVRSGIAGRSSNSLLWTDEIHWADIAGRLVAMENRIGSPVVSLPHEHT